MNDAGVQQVKASKVAIIGQDFILKQNYVKLFKERAQLAEVVDPRVQYFLQCTGRLNLALPILEKVIFKTLVLQNYTLSEGHCVGLTEACGLLDSRKVNRLLLNNCGVSGKQFASILAAV